MKTLNNILGLLALFLFPLTTLAGTNTNAYCMEFSISAKLKTSYVGGCTVTLLEGDSVVQVLTQPDKKLRYNVCLRENTQYTVLVTCPGYYDRKVSISTVKPGGRNTGVIFDLDAVVQMFPTNIAMDEDFSDHPVAIVEYIPADDAFEFRSQYSFNYKKIVPLESRM